MPCPKMVCDMRFATLSVLKIPPWSYPKFNNTNNFIDCIPVKVGIVHRELCVVLVEDRGRRHLNRHGAQGEPTRLSVRTAHHLFKIVCRRLREDTLVNVAYLDVILGPPVPDLDEDECEVVDEEEGVGEAEGELYQPWVGNVLLLSMGQVAEVIK